MEDLQLRLLAKLPIYIDGIPIYSPELINIADVGLEKYQQLIIDCTIDKNILNMKAKTELKELDDFDILTLFILQQEDFLEDFLESLCFFTKKEFAIAEQDTNLFFFYFEQIGEQKICRQINRNNYKKFIKVIRFVNRIENIEPEEELDEFDRRVLEAERKIKEAESKDSVIVPFKDLVSSVANMGDNNLNILNIWDLNIFTFYDQLKRGQKKEAYFIGLKQLLAGVEPKEVDLDYYIKKLD